MNAKVMEVGKELVSDYLAEIFELEDLKSFARACKMIGTHQEIDLTDLDAVFKIDNHFKKFLGCSMFSSRKNRKQLEVALKKHGIIYA